MSDSVRVSRSLWIHALADAIDWTESLLEAQGKAPNPDDVRLLARYQRAYARVTGSKRGPIQSALDNATSVQIQDIQPSDELIYPGRRGRPDLSSGGTDNER